MGNARMPNIVLASTIAVHFPSPGQAICMYSRPYSLILLAIDAIGRGLLSGLSSIDSKGEIWAGPCLRCEARRFRATSLMRLKPEQQ
jgi:hypothetical protein